MLRIRFTALSLLVGATLCASPALFAQSVTDSYVAGTGNETIMAKHLLNGVLVGNNNSTEDPSDLLSTFTVVGNGNVIETAAIVFGNNNTQRAVTPGMASGSVQVGRNNVIEGETNIQVGLFNRTEGTSNTTSGMNNNVQGNQNLVTGHVVTVSGTGNAVTGWGGKVEGDNNARVGTGGSIQGSNNVMLGNSVEITGSNQVVAGTSARGFADGCVAIGHNSQCFESNEFSVGMTNNERRVTNVAPGIRYTDAANVGQVRSVAQTFGGGADVINGVFVEPLFEFRGGASYNNVAEAMYYLDGRVTNLEQNPGTGPGAPGPQGPQGPAGQDGKDGVGGGSTVTAGKNVVVTDNNDGTQTVGVSDTISLSDEGALKVAKATLNGEGLSIQGGASVTTSGVNAGGQRVSGVATGAIAPGSMDAINGGQMWDYQRQQDDRWNLTDRRFRELDKRVSGVCAMAQANAQMATSTSAIHGENRNRLAVGVGGCNGQGAVSIGYTRDVTTPRGSPSAFSVGISRSGRDSAVGAAWAIGW
jgi:hypothetical protein